MYSPRVPRPERLVRLVRRVRKRAKPWRVVTRSFFLVLTKGGEAQVE